MTVIADISHTRTRLPTFSVAGGVNAESPVFIGFVTLFHTLAMVAGQGSNYRNGCGLWTANPLFACWSLTRPSFTESKELRARLAITGGRDLQLWRSAQSSLISGKICFKREIANVCAACDIISHVGACALLLSLVALVLRIANCQLLQE